MALRKKVLQMTLELLDDPYFSIYGDLIKKLEELKIENEDQKAILKTYQDAISPREKRIREAISWIQELLKEENE